MWVLDDKEVIQLLRSEVKKAGGQSAWSRRERVNRTSLNLVINGRLAIPPSIIRALNLRAVSQYNACPISSHEILNLLRSEVEKAGSQFDWAQREGINRTMLNKVINGRKTITPSIKEALKVRTVYLRDARTGTLGVGRPSNSVRHSGGA
jgi:DNA-binding transcriptional regulator YdaS (Cro superfamily)